VDILQSLWLQIPFNVNYPSYQDFPTPLGINILDYVETRIGGRTIDRITGEQISNLLKLRLNDDLQTVLQQILEPEDRLVYDESRDSVYIPLPIGILCHGSRPFPFCSLNQPLEIFVKLNLPSCSVAEHNRNIIGARIWATGYVLPPVARDYLMNESNIPLIVGN